MKKFLVGLCLLAATGCASIATPNTYNQRLAYVEATSTAILQTTHDLLKRDRISVPTAIKVDEQMENVNLLISNAKIAASVKDTKTAAGYLEQANKILIQLQTTLQEQQNGK
jgi:hypothetical protein